MGAKEKLKEVVTAKSSSTITRAKSRVRNRAMLKESRKIALKILEKLEELGWSQKKLAETIGVSPQQVNKLVKGKENVTLETQVRLQEILQIPILASFYEEGEFEIIKTVVKYKKIDWIYQDYIGQKSHFDMFAMAFDSGAVINRMMDGEAYAGESDQTLLPTG